MLANSSFNLGMEYSVKVIDSETKEIKEQTGWGHNLIMDDTAQIFMSGFSEAPTPLLGTDGRAVVANQDGPISPSPDMVLIDTIHNPADTQFTTISDGSLVVWDYTYEFLNTSSLTVILKEIGIPGFNRALLYSAYGDITTITVTPSDTVLVSARFVLLTKTPSHTLSIVDEQGVVQDTFTVTYNHKASTDIALAHWWKLLGVPSIELVTATGVVTLNELSVAVNSSNRKIEYHYKITNEDEVGLNSIRYTYKCGIPIIEGKFNKVMSVPAIQKIELFINAQW